MKILAATAANFECQEMIPMKTRSEYFEIKINITDYIYIYFFQILFQNVFWKIEQVCITKYIYP